MKINFNKELTNLDIENLCKDFNIPLFGVFMRDTIPTDLPAKSFFVVNLNKSGEAGSHWCCAVRYNKNIFWFDSFGFPCPQDCINTFTKLKLKIWFSEDIYQNINSVICGYYCIAFLLFVNSSNITRKNNIFVIVHNWCGLFKNQDGKNNDNVIKKIISDKYNSINKI